MINDMKYKFLLVHIINIKIKKIKTKIKTKKKPKVENFQLRSFVM